MASKKKLKAMAQELKRVHIPQSAIWNLNSLSDNFIYSLLINSPYGEQIRGMSVVELSLWLQKNNLVNDYNVLELILGDNYTKEVQDGQ